LTEFLPVSSSGHLTVAEYLLGYNPEKELLFKLVVHLGTLLAVIWVYRRSLTRYMQELIGLFRPLEERTRFERLRHEDWSKEIQFILLATIPTGLIGILFNKSIKAAFSSLTIVGLMFAITGILLFSSRFFPNPHRHLYELGWWRAVLIGVAQGFAIMPGISRSGTTIIIALMLGLRREESARYSFLLAIPAIAGALVLEGRKANLDSIVWMPLVTGLVVSMITGYLALIWLIRLVKQGQLQWFAPYMWIAASFTLVLSLNQGKAQTMPKTPVRAVKKISKPTPAKTRIHPRSPKRSTSATPVIR
jgi:undecaprenyl-diphosphatase